MTGSPVAVVTGAARGLGAAVAAALDERGYRLVLTDIAADPAAPQKPATDGYPYATWDDLAKVAAGCAEAVAVRADVRVQSDLDAAVGIARGRFGRLDAAVAVAGVIAGGPPLWETDDRTWRMLQAVDLDGVFHLVRAAVPALLSAPAGRFVAVSSAAGTRPLARLAAYSAAKHGVVGLVRSLAADLAGTTVTANVVCPGSMDTMMLAETARVYDLDGVDEFAQHAFQRRILDPAEVAEAVGWLCSPAAGALTGAVVPVDAGFTG
ncbi:mycofactocin-coupled SDR family oxidoreductase [Frankia sp. Cppng1_Ct_nod]|uniref:mycofactocin-coupled SDR family oxidoreductase n=1 Tax=Frankia sp. Cppng1_Ct_nod TaxID=2897162 RepID=UPI001040F1DE|nr:mycofactocin-coupled SDR family oxidoreductase [Frankia sp. Cppng1_Ct_nod]